MAKGTEHIAELSPTERAALVSRLKQQRAAEREGARAIPRRGEAAHYPLSFAQQRLWFLEQLEPDGPYKVPAAFRLRGPLQVAALEQSVNEIISRHEVLRTTFAEIEGRPVQIVAPRLTLSIPVEDLSGLPEIERAERVKQIAARLREKPFDFERGPLVGAALVRLDQEEYHFRHPRRLLLEEFVNTSVTRKVAARLVPFEEELAPLFIREQRERAEVRGRIVDRGVEKDREVLEHPRDGRAVK